MYLDNGVWKKGSPPKNNLKSPKIIKHRSQKTAVAPSGMRLDSLLKGGEGARILIYRSLGGTGDIIMSLPIAKGAKRKYPNCHVTYAIPLDYAGGNISQIFEHNPYIDEVIDYRLVNRNDYDIFGDTTRVGLSRETPHSNPPNRIDLFSSAAGIPLYGDYIPTYIITKEEEEWAKSFIKERLVGITPPKGIISIHLRSNDPKRTWPQNRIREFVSLAGKKGYFTILIEWGERSDRWRHPNSTTMFGYSLREVAAVINESDVLVCPDSALLHLGGAVNSKMVSLFGSMPPSCRINHYPNAIAIVNQKLPCIGCVYEPCSNSISYYCMSSITPEMVLEACQKKISDELITPSSSLDNETITLPGTSISKKIKTTEI